MVVIERAQSKYMYQYLPTPLSSLDSNGMGGGIACTTSKDSTVY